MFARTAVVAGRSYPSVPVTLNQQLDALLEKHKPRLARRNAPKALIVPHSSYAYSGATAAIAYRCLIPYANIIQRVAVVGLSHRVAFRGVATTSVSRFSTPLGDVCVDKEITGDLLKIPFVHQREEACEQEQSLEAHLPFLQKTLGSFKLIPLLAGGSSGETLLICLQKLWKEKDTLVIISSDLSQSHSYDDAVIVDRDTCSQIVAKKASITSPQATGFRGINALLKLVQASHFQISMLDYRNSGDTCGDNECVFGYGAFVVSENSR